ncbi:MAG: hypothetical protein ACFFAH_14730 [Promethearchaeota archaeon]
MVSLGYSGSTLMAYILNSNSKICVEHEDNAKPLYLFNIYNLQWKILHGFEKYLNSLLIQKEYLVTSRYFDKKQIILINSALGKKAKYIILTRSFMWRLYRMKGFPSTLPLKNLVKFFICKHYVMNKFEYVKVSYNEMVSKPIETFLKICKFIGVDFEPEMLNYQKFEHNKIRGNPKVWKFQGIIDKSANERINLNMILTAIKFRLYHFKKKFLKKLFHE